ncbi:hypothetical protein [Algoriphagus formosus]|uniref:hypothetical protein n=1 Tax=Algoriphagus formosus TaxID=2007308 RepID=UPI003F7036A6
MKEFLDFLQTIGERLRSRVFGPFIISLVFWNWKPILMILASNCPIEDTIWKIEYQEMFTFYNIFLIPLGISMSYSILVPFISLGLGWLVIWPQGKSIQSNYILKGKRRKEDVKIAKLDFEYETTKAGNLELEELNNKVSILTKEKENHISEIDSLKNVIESLKQENINLGETFKLDQENRFNRLIDRFSSDLNLTKGFLLEEINRELQEANFLLKGIEESKINYLKNEKLIAFYNQEGIDLGYTFTDDGRKTYINFLQRTKYNLS